MAGANSLFDLSRQLKEAGNKQLRKEMSKALRDAAKPLIKDTRDAAKVRLPQRGGLAKRMSKAPQRVQIRTGARTVGVRIVLKAQPGITTGQVRHPVFGRDVFVTQKIDGEWWDDTLAAGRDRVIVPINHALERVARQITGG